MLGTDEHCIVTLVDPKSGSAMIGKLKVRTVAELSRAAIRLINAAARRIRSVTVDNGTEFHGYKAIEAATSPTECYELDSAA